MPTNSINVKVIVNDNGTLSLTEKSARKLNKTFKQTTSGVMDSDRAWKGASKQSSNLTKNFSKMQQGMGGLVAAYATLAANIFAITAAFRFLTEAGDLRVLQEGQVAYASATGIALTTLTKQLIKATDSQIKFSDASQAAAIGTAAGLDVSQLTDLAKGAKDVSLLLGRDVTDSFNRLVRGVTKAEPELLDELGIVLRLKDASEKYKVALGITSQELTTFQKGQAVALEVSTQLEKKFGDVADQADVQINAFNKLGKSFDDLINKVKTVSATLVEPLASLAAINPFALILISAPLVSTVLKVLIPSMASVGAATQKWSAASAEAAKITQLSVGRARKAYSLLTSDLVMASNQQFEAAKSLQVFTKGLSGVTLNLRKVQQGVLLTTKEYIALEQAVNRSTGAFIKQTATQKAQRLSAIADAKLASQVINKEIGATTLLSTKITGTTKIGISQIKNFATTAVASTTRVVASAVSNIGLLFSRILPIAGTALLVFSLIPDSIIDWAKAAIGIRVVSEEVQEVIEKVEGLNKEFKNLAKTQSAALSSLGTGISAFSSAITNIGKASSALTLDEARLAIQEYNDILAQQDGLWGNILSKVSSLDPTGLSFFGAIAKTLNESRAADAEKIVKPFNIIAEALKSTSLSATKSGARYIAALEALQDPKNRGNREIAEEFLKAKIAYQDFSKAVDAGVLANTRALEGFTSLLLEIVPTNKFDTIIKDSEESIEGLQTHMKDILNTQAELIPEMQKELNTRKDTLSILVRLREVEVRRLLDQKKLSILTNKQLRNATKGQSKLIKLLSEESDLKSQIALNADKAALLLESQGVEAKDLTGALKTAYETHLLTEEVLKSQLDLIKDQISSVSEISATIRNAFERDLTGLFTDLITNEESSLKDAILKMGKGILTSLAGNVSKLLTEQVFSALNIGSPAKRNAETVLDAHKEGAAEIGKEAKNHGTVIITEMGKGADLVHDKIVSGFAAAKAPEISKMDAPETNRITTTNTEQVVARGTEGLHLKILQAHVDGVKLIIKASDLLYSRIKQALEEGSIIAGQNIKSIISSTQLVVDPAVLTQEPASITVKQEPAIIRQEPVNITHEPINITQEPASITVKQEPAIIRQEPVNITHEPINITQEPASITVKQEPAIIRQEPVNITHEPINITQEPASITVKQEPAIIRQEPVNITHEPINITQEPASITVKQEPAIIRQEPVNITHEPINITQEPASITVKQEPAIIRQEPVNITHEPINITQEPAIIRQEPVNITHEPINITQEPASITVKQEPAIIRQEPVNITHEPINITQEPASITVKQEPAIIRQEPVNITHEPINITQEPASITVKQEPAIIRQEPVNITHEPINITQEPAIIRQEPVNITHEPINITQEPASITVKQEPAIIRQEPVNITHEPINITQEPASITVKQEPAIIRQEPVNITHEPINITQEPASITVKQEPAIIRQEPVNITHEPINITQEPAIIRQEPVNITHEPINITQEPASITVKQEPAIIRQEPVNITHEPINITQEPASITVKQEPAIIRQEPVNITHEPINITQEPAIIRQEPVNITHEPINITQEPASITVKQEPAIIRQEPVNITHEPINITQEPASITVKQEPAIIRQEPVNITHEPINITHEKTENLAVVKAIENQTAELTASKRKTTEPPEIKQGPPMSAAMRREEEAQEPGVLKGFFGAIKELFKPTRGKTEITETKTGGVSSNLADVKKLPERMSDVFASFGDVIGSIFSKDSSFLQGLASVFTDGTQGFGSLFKSLIGGLLGALGNSAGGTDSNATVVSGVVGAVISGGFQSFANGSANISKPTLGMVGEGRFNEAVVPLPDGKSIPVQMNGSNSQINSEVNITIADGQVTSEDSTSDADQAKMLGRLVSRAVQRELSTQSRPGGILSPFGASR